MPPPHRPSPASSSSGPRLYVITDRRATKGRDAAAVVEVIRAVVAAVPPGAVLVQVREKDLPARDLVALVARIVTVAAERDCAVLVNDRLDVALAAGAAGVHLPERGLPIAAVRALAGPDVMIGASTHDADAAARAARDGADVIVCGPVWATPSKAGMGSPLGLAALGRAARAVAASGARLHALGGVTTPGRAQEARQAGAHGIAGIRAFMAAADPGAAAAALVQALITAA